MVVKSGGKSKVICRFLTTLRVGVGTPKPYTVQGSTILQLATVSHRFKSYIIILGKGIEMYKLNPHLSYQEVNRYLLNRTNQQKTIWALLFRNMEANARKKNS